MHTLKEIQPWCIFCTWSSRLPSPLVPEVALEAAGVACLVLGAVLQGRLDVLQRFGRDGEPRVRKTPPILRLQVPGSRRAETLS